MAQCKAETASGAQCVSDVVPPSRTLCKRHQNMLATGKTVTNIDTGRAFPAPKASAVATAPSNGSTAAKRAAATPGARVATATPRRAAASTAVAQPRARAARASSSAAAPAAALTATAERKRGPGEHSLYCGGPGCTNMSLPGSDYCMQHQNLA